MLIKNIFTLHTPIRFYQRFIISSFIPSISTISLNTSLYHLFPNPSQDHLLKSLTITSHHSIHQPLTHSIPNFGRSNQSPNPYPSCSIPPLTHLSLFLYKSILFHNIIILSYNSPTPLFHSLPYSNNLFIYTHLSFTFLHPIITSCIKTLPFSIPIHRIISYTTSFLFP